MLLFLSTFTLPSFCGCCFFFSAPYITLFHLSSCYWYSSSLPSPSLLFTAVLSSLLHHILRRLTFSLVSTTLALYLHHSFSLRLFHPLFCSTSLITYLLFIYLLPSASLLVTVAAPLPPMPSLPTPLSSCHFSCSSFQLSSCSQPASVSRSPHTAKPSTMRHSSTFTHSFFFSLLFLLSLAFPLLLVCVALSFTFSSES